MLPRIICLCALVAISVATDVRQCKGKSIANLSDNVQLMPCNKPPCKLRRGTSQHITIKFTPGPLFNTDIAELKNHVEAEVFGIPLPFVGVDGISVCDKLENGAGEKVACPLKAGDTYVYKDTFPVLKIYPTLNVAVHWALQHAGKDVICFEVPAKIL